MNESEHAAVHTLQVDGVSLRSPLSRRHGVCGVMAAGCALAVWVEWLARGVLRVSGSHVTGVAVGECRVSGRGWGRLDWWFVSVGKYRVNSI